MSYDRKRGWVQGTEGHGLVELMAHTDKEDYKTFGLKQPVMRQTRIQAVANMGCQASLMRLESLHKIGLQKKDLVRVRANAGIQDTASSPAIQQLPPAGDEWQHNAGTPARAPPARRQVRFAERLVQEQGSPLARAASYASPGATHRTHQAEEPQEQDHAGQVQGLRHGRGGVGRQQCHRQDRVTAGMGGMLGMKTTTCMTLYTPAGETADETEGTAVYQLPVTIDVSHVVLHGGVLVQVYNLPVIGVHQGRLVIKRP